MKSQMKRVTSLGLGLVMTGSLLTACNAPQSGEPGEEAAAESVAQTGAETGPAQTDQSETAPAEVAASAVGGEGEGEGGIIIADASEDPVIFNASLAITAAHVIAARDAHAVGNHEAAAEMFAHPVSEVLLDMEPVYLERGVELFDGLMTETSLAVFDGETSAQIAARSEGILQALAAASTHAPDDGSTPAQIAAGVTADQLDRAADMYRIALADGTYEPYLDGYGYYKSAEMAFESQAAAIEAELPESAARIRAAFELLAEAYPDAAQPETLDFDRAELASAAAQAGLAVINAQ